MATLIDLAGSILDHDIPVASGDVELKDCIHALGGRSIKSLRHPDEDLFDIPYSHLVILSVVRPVSMVQRRLQNGVLVTEPAYNYSYPVMPILSRHYLLVKWIPLWATAC